MPTLPTVKSVIEITGTDIGGAVVSAIIDDAASLVSDCIVTYDAARQASIIKWVAAHLISSTAAGGEKVLTSWKLGDAAETYGRASLGDGLRGTVYGQQALLLDTNGCLTGLGKGRASVQVI